MQVFSDVIEKAQNVIALMHGNLDTPLTANPRVCQMLKVFNVSTQADTFTSQKNAKQNTDAIKRNDKETNTAELNQTITISEHNEPLLKQDAGVQVKESQENKLVGTAEVSTSATKKLSTHLLPSVQITRELVTQKIPSVIISPTDSIPDVTNTNLGYEIIKYDSGDELYKMINIVKDMRERDQKSNSDDHKKNNVSNAANETPTNSDFRTTPSKFHKGPQDSTAQYMWKSYQVYENPKIPQAYSLPEVDSNTLSRIDDDVYKTFVNPHGKRNQADTKSNKPAATNVEKKSNITDEPDEQPVRTISNSSLTLDENSKASITSILTKNRKSLNEFMNDLQPYSNDTNHSAFPNLYLNPISINRTNSEYDLDKNEFLEDEKSLPNNGEPRKFPRDIMTNMKIDSAVSSNIKDHMAHARSLNTKDREQTHSTSERLQERLSNTSRFSEKDFSDSTEQMILSIDKVNIRRKSEFYENDARKLSLFDILETSSNKRNSSKVKPLHKIKSSFKNYDSSDERIMMQDIKLQTMSTNVPSEDSSKNSKESAGSSAHNTDESIKIIHVSDSMDEGIVYCSYCSKFCFRRNRHVYDDAYAVSSNRNSVQYIYNTDSLKSQALGKISETRDADQSIDEFNRFLERKNNVNVISQDNVLPSDSSGKIDGSEDTKEEKGKLSNDQGERDFRVSNVSAERKRSVKIEIPESQNVDTRKNSTMNSTTSPNYPKDGIIKKSSIDFHEKNITVMNVNIDQSTATDIEIIKGGGGDKISVQSSKNENIVVPTTLNCLESERKEKLVDLKRILFCHKTKNSEKNSQMKDECEQSDGEILSKCDCSIGEICLGSTDPESIFIHDLHKSHEEIVDRKVRNSNWISYYVKPFRGYKTYTPVPINDSSDSFS